jgi:hypothetical protein
MTYVAKETGRFFYRRTRAAYTMSPNEWLGNWPARVPKLGEQAISDVE